jgi:hypothetical protein
MDVASPAQATQILMLFELRSVLPAFIALARLARAIRCFASGLISATHDAEQLCREELLIGLSSGEHSLFAGAQKLANPGQGN